MKSFLLFALGLCLSLSSFAQDAKEVLQYTLEVSCECGSKKFAEIVPTETQTFVAKVGGLKDEALRNYLKEINPEELQKHLTQLMQANSVVEGKCNETALEPIILKKYPNAKEVLDKAQQEGSLQDVMSMIDNIENCSFLKNSMVVMMGVSMMEMEKGN